MKTIRITVLALAAMTVLRLWGTGAPAEKVLQSQWATEPVRVDGATQEWQDAVFFVDKRSKAEYALRNDGEHLYILFVFKSLPALSTYEVSGMRIYYAVNGKKDKSLGFHFHRKNLTADQLIAEMEKGGQPLLEDKKAEVRKQKGYTIYEGTALDPQKAAVQPGDKGEPPTYRDKVTPRVSMVEFRIPLALLAEAGAVAAPGSTIKLGFEWGGMTAEMRSAYMARMADSGSQARGAGGGDLGSQLESGYEGGGEGGGGGGSMGGRPDPRTRKHSFWIDVKLAGPDR
jgi:hypothetical protein